MRTFTLFSRSAYTPPAKEFKIEEGPSAGSPFEQISSMYRLTGVPSPISGGTDTVGSGLARN